MKNTAPIFDKRNPQQRSLLISSLQRRVSTPSQLLEGQREKLKSADEKNVLSLLSADSAVTDFDVTLTVPVPAPKQSLHTQSVSVPHVDLFLGGWSALRLSAS